VKDFQTLLKPSPTLIFTLGYHDPKPTRAKKASRTHSLTGAKAHKARPKSKPHLGWPDGRRKFGTVSGAIVRCCQMPAAR
jgi:hypothetical protein